MSRWTKGTAVAVTLDLVRDRWGDDGIAKLSAALPKSVREALGAELRAIATARYPFEVWIEVLLAAQSLFGSAVVRESSRVGYRELLRTTYRSIVRDDDPAETLRRLPRLWAQITEGIGNVEVVENEDTMQVLVDLEIPERHWPIGYERVAGLVEALIEAGGGTATVHVTTRGQQGQIWVTITKGRSPTSASSS